MKKTVLQPIVLLAALALLAWQGTTPGLAANGEDQEAEPAAARDTGHAGLTTEEMDWDNYPAGQDAEEAEAWEEELEAEAEPLLPWHDTLEDAIAAARERRTAVLILFSGDTHRARRFEEVLASEEVSNWLLNEFELYRIDYRQNRPFAHSYHVRRFPYMVILNRFGFTVGHAIPVEDPNLLLERLAPHKQTLY